MERGAVAEVWSLTAAGDINGVVQVLLEGVDFIPIKCGNINYFVGSKSLKATVLQRRAIKSPNWGLVYRQQQR